MIDLGKFNILGISINGIDYAAAVEKVIKAARESKPFAVSALAVHGVMTGVLDKEQAYRLNQFDLLVPDGQPVRWAINWLYGSKLKERVYGPTLMLKICDRAAEQKIPIALYGSKPEVLRTLSERLKKKFPNLRIVYQQPSKFRQLSKDEQAQIANQINNSGAKVVFVGLGCPRQEVWAYENRDLVKMPMIAVGAAFDFHAGLLPQAPFWMQKRGLEWVFRFIQEPKRLYQRYLVLNPLFTSLLLLQILRIRKFSCHSKLQSLPSYLGIG